MILKSGIVKYFSVVCCLLMLCTACKKNDVEIYDLDDIRERGVLRVITLETAFSYYVDRDERECGLDYDMARNFADYLGVEFELILAENNEDVVDKLLSGEGDLVAHRMQLSKRNMKFMSFTDRKDYTSMVLVQRRERGRVSDVTELVGKRVWTQRKSKYDRRLQNINEELGGGIRIGYVPDSVSVEDMIYLVAKRKIDYCVADADIASLVNQRLGNVECGLKVGFNEPKAWAVNKQSDSLLNELNVWMKKIKGSKFEKKLYSKYITHNEYLKAYQMLIPEGDISPFDAIFKHYAPQIGWDWRMLAAVSWVESRFDIYALSSQGAMGLMQMMPMTAVRCGLEGDDIYNPVKSIAAAVKYLQFLDKIFKEVKDDEERIKFILAGYNAGLGHVKDAMALAEKYGSNPYKWEESVEDWMMKLRYKEYYDDPLCVHGFYRAGYTIRYVNDIYAKYNEYVAVHQEEFEDDILLMNFTPKDIN